MRPPSLAGVSLLLWVLAYSRLACRAVLQRTNLDITQATNGVGMDHMWYTINDTQNTVGTAVAMLGVTGVAGAMGVIMVMMHRVRW